MLSGRSACAGTVILDRGRVETLYMGQCGCGRGAVVDLLSPFRVECEECFSARYREGLRRE